MGDVDVPLEDFEGDLAANLGVRSKCVDGTELEHDLLVDRVLCKRG